MANNTKKYVSLNKLGTFLENLTNKFASISHKHTVSDITDYVRITVDSQLSPTSTNPVQNKVVDAEFDAIGDAMGALELAIDGKANSAHNHDDRYYTEAEVDGKIDEAKASASNKDAVVLAEAQKGINNVQTALDTHESNTALHIASNERTNWNAAKTHADSAHARVDATKVADSTTNGNILINGTETNVYSHPNSGVTAGTYKSVTVNAQGHITGGSNPTTLSGYGITDAETKSDASKKLTEAKTYADSAATTAANKVKNDLLNGAGGAYDTLKELGDLIDDNQDAIEALELVASGKADKTHAHAIADVSGLQSALDGKAASSHGTHVSYSTAAPVMDGTASVGSASTVARSDHKHPTDTSRASKAEFDSHDSNTTKHITATERTNWNSAKTTADSAKTRADNAYTLAESKAGSLSDLGITVTATELNHMDGITSNVQAQLDQLQDDIDSITQADWNQNDSTKPDFINNRPFYTTDPVETVIAEGTIPANGMLQTSASINSLTLGETYNAVFDGVAYNNLVCVNYDGLPSLGNDAFVFAIQSGRAMAYAANGSVSHTIKVMALISSIVSLERKYIAEHIDNLAGEKVAGKSYTIDGSQVTAGKGAEVFNDYSTNIASGQYSHAEGINNIASGSASHAEGYGVEASGSYSHAEGYETTASESRSHAEGWSTEATAQASHAEGFATHATGQFSHAEGDNAAASGRAAHAENYGTEAIGDYSHAEGMNTNASSKYQHVQGQYNVIDANNKYAHIVGNGSSNYSRSNAHTLDWYGNSWFKGDVYVGGASQDDASASKLISESDVLITVDDIDTICGSNSIGMV